MVVDLLPEPQSEAGTDQPGDPVVTHAPGLVAGEVPLVDGVHDEQSDAYREHRRRGGCETDADREERTVDERVDQRRGDDERERRGEHPPSRYASFQGAEI